MILAIEDVTSAIIIKCLSHRRSDHILLKKFLGHYKSDLDHWRIFLQPF